MPMPTTFTISPLLLSSSKSRQFHPSSQMAASVLYRRNTCLKFNFQCLISICHPIQALSQKLSRILNSHNFPREDRLQRSKVDDMSLCKEDRKRDNSIIPQCKYVQGNENSQEFSRVVPIGINSLEYYFL